MNNTFNITRFGLLIKRQWLEFGKIYLVTLGVVAVIIISFYGYSIFSEKINYGTLSFREPLFVVLGIIFITIISSNYFAHLGQKPKAIIDLLIPASSFEKIITGILFTSILSFCLYILIFYVVDFLFVSRIIDSYKETITSTENGVTTTEVRQLHYFFPPYFHERNFFIALIVGGTGILLSSLFFLGSIYFNKFHYIKTLVSIMVFIAIYVAIMVKFLKTIFEGKVSIVRTKGIPETQGMWLAFSVILLLTLVFYVISFIRLKEKEV